MKRLLPLLVLVGLALAAYASGLGHYLSLDTLRDNRHTLLAWTDANPIQAALAYMALYALMVAVSLPGASIMTLAGGFLFGTWLGGSLTVAAATVGATLLFIAALSAFGGILGRRAGPFLARMGEGFRRDAFSYLLSLRLMPLFPFWVVNLVAALAGMRLHGFVAATAIGIIPGTFAYAAFGAGLAEAFDSGVDVSLNGILNPTLLAGLAVLGLLALVPALWRRRG
jgi:uncharacterized membrane protein YdjX (TVP38/TMEM64 family)